MRKIVCNGQQESRITPAVAEILDPEKHLQTGVTLKCGGGEYCFMMQRCLDDGVTWHGLTTHGIRLQHYGAYPPGAPPVACVVYRVNGLDQSCVVCPFCRGEL